MSKDSQKPQKKLREGFSTGSSVAAGAAAALRILLGGEAPDEIHVALPPFTGEGVNLLPERNARKGIPVAYAQRLTCGMSAHTARPSGYSAGAAKAAIIKDGGDDPDATNGMLIEVYAALDEACFAFLPGVWLELEAGLRMKCGPGVGIATLPGLPVAPGEPAVNPHPRRQIAYAVLEELGSLRNRHQISDGNDRATEHAPVFLYLRIPQGEEKAGNTLNSRLGIVGGVSILGTRGTVRPYSHEAWQATISQGLDIAVSLGLQAICFSTGRRSELGLQRLYPDFSEQSFIQAADFARFSVTEAARRSFRKIVWGCYCGKLLKLAQGLPYTHARSAPADLPLLARWAGQCGAPPELCMRIEAMPTAQGAFDLLEAHDASLSEAVLKKVAKTALATLTAWLSGSEAALQLCVLRPDNALWLQLEGNPGPA